MRSLDPYILLSTDVSMFIVLLSSPLYHRVLVFLLCVTRRIRRYVLYVTKRVSVYECVCFCMYVCMYICMQVYTYAFCLTVN